MKSSDLQALIAYRMEKSKEAIKAMDKIRQVSKDIRAIVKQIV